MTRPKLGVKERCCGCGACVDACPVKALYVSQDEYGFLHWDCDENKCVGCGKCERACPLITEPSTAIPFEAYAVVNKGDSVLMASSSGGVFHDIAQGVLRGGGVVYGAEMDDEFQVRHARIESEDELSRLQRSKYVQSDLGGCFSQVANDLKGNRCVLFSGVPCQIAAMKSYLAAVGVDPAQLLTCEVVCHGVPSQRMFDEYLDNLQKRTGKIDSYTFRAKRGPRNGMNWFFSYSTNKRTYIRNWPEDSFNYAYMTGAIYRDSCYSCPYAKLARAADLTLCDYWHWDEFHGNDFDPDTSLSAVLLNTEKGMQAFLGVCEGFMFARTDYASVAAHNSCLVKPTPKSANRELLLSSWAETGYGCVDERFRKGHRLQRLKYAVMRHLPKGVLSFCARSK